MDQRRALRGCVDGTWSWTGRHVAQNVLQKKDFETYSSPCSNLNITKRCTLYTPVLQDEKLLVNILSLHRMCLSLHKEGLRYHYVPIRTMSSLQRHYPSMFGTHVFLTDAGDQTRDLKHLKQTANADVAMVAVERLHVLHRCHYKP